MIHEHDLDSGRVLTIHEEVWTGAKRDGVKEARKKVKVPYMFMEASVETLMYTADATASVVMIPGVAIDYIPEEKRDRIKVLNRPDACRTIMMAVGRTCMKEKLVEAVRESVMVVAGQYAFADFLRT